MLQDYNLVITERGSQTNMNRGVKRTAHRKFADYQSHSYSSQVQYEMC